MGLQDAKQWRRKDEVFICTSDNQSCVGLLVGAGSKHSTGSLAHLIPRPRRMIQGSDKGADISTYIRTGSTRTHHAALAKGVVRRCTYHTCCKNRNVEKRLETRGLPKVTAYYIEKNDTRKRDFGENDLGRRGQN